MPGSALLPRPLHRLLAAVLALSVLMTTLGLAHPCAALAQDADTLTGLVEHPTPPGAPTEHDDCGNVAHRASGHHQDEGRPGNAGHTGHDAPDTGACALAAHCAVTVVLTAADVPAPRMLPATLPVTPIDVRHQGPSYQPASPPPKV